MGRGQEWAHLKRFDFFTCVFFFQYDTDLGVPRFLITTTEKEVDTYALTESLLSHTAPAPPDEYGGRAYECSSAS